MSWWRLAISMTLMLFSASRMSWSHEGWNQISPAESDGMSGSMIQSIQSSRCGSESRWSITFGREMVGPTVCHPSTTWDDWLKRSHDETNETTWSIIPSSTKFITGPSTWPTTCEHHSGKSLVVVAVPLCLHPLPLTQQYSSLCLPHHAISWSNLFASANSLLTGWSGNSLSDSP